MESPNQQKNARTSTRLFFLSSFVMFTPGYATPTVYFDSSTYFGFNNGWMNFADTQVFNVVYETSGFYWYFDQVGISLDGVNATVLSWLVSNKIVLNLTDISPTCTIQVDLSGINPTATASGADSYSTSSGILTVTKSSFSIATVTINLTPITIGSFVSSSYTISQNVPFYVNATVYDEWGIVSLQSFTLELSSEYQVIASWNMGAWTIPAGSVNCMLIPTGCSVSQIDNYTEVFTFELEFMGNLPETSVDVLSAGTLASDAYGNSATGSMLNIATYPGAPQTPGESGGPTYPTPENPTNPTNETTPTTPPTNETTPTNTTGPFSPPTNPQIPP